MSESWHLIAPAEDPRADGVHLVLLALAQPVTRDAAGPLPVLLPPGRAPVDLRDIEAVLAALPGTSDARREAALRSERALARLGPLDPAAFPADLDLVIYALRQELRRLEDFARTRPDDGDALFLAPLLWRIGLLDRHHDLFLLSDLPRLALLQGDLMARPLVAGFYDAGAAARYLHHLQSGRIGQPPRTDWSRALGPEGREKSLLPRGRRMKDPSIGSVERFR